MGKKNINLNFLASSHTDLYLLLRDFGLQLRFLKVHIFATRRHCLPLRLRTHSEGPAEPHFFGLRGHFFGLGVFTARGIRVIHQPGFGLLVVGLIVDLRVGFFRRVVKVVVVLVAFVRLFGGVGLLVGFGRPVGGLGLIVDLLGLIAGGRVVAGNVSSPG